VKDNQDKQLALFPQRSVKVSKEYLFDPWKHREHVLVTTRFDNSRENNLGIPLPAGIVRVYKLDDDGTRQFVGEDRLEHTPRDEPVSLSLGQVFDLAAQRKVTQEKAVGKSGRRSTVEMEIRNHKEEQVTVKLRDHLPGSARIISADGDYRRPSSTIVEFTVVVPAGETVVRSYTYQLKRDGILYR